MKDDSVDYLSPHWPIKPVYLTSKPANLDIKSHVDFLFKNEGDLFVQVVSLTGGGLLQSRITTRCFDEATVGERASSAESVGRFWSRVKIRAEKQGKIEPTSATGFGATS